MDTLVQWDLFDHGGAALSTDVDIAGRGVMFIVVDDVAAERRRLQGLGIMLGDDIEGDYSTLAQVRDPDGNLVTLATPPARPLSAGRTAPGDREARDIQRAGPANACRSETSRSGALPVWNGRSNFATGALPSGRRLTGLD